ncbi:MULTISPECIES: carboxylic ester hydrolase [unclassified Capnocytophaga]|uniref:alpha/beta hydrolase n=1 Tax=unclassified Capnocytophaga TaxID=2640652 RepID=UPI00026F33D2|nr:MULTISPECIES: carboxylic ester hydrolase [unclassified Capnocytophaga]ALC97954.1 carboxylic ester hydrolase [Capnocytophaga sp. oral taxon 323]EJF36662.1 platelet-activating factor acetylhydrolase, isoform II domain protein [Capnocytophaga sp. oral taxon 335 str. F0486]
MKKKKMYILITILLFLLLLVGGAYYIFRPALFAKPMGKYAVGTVSYWVTDPDREEIFITDKHQARQIPIQVWYPAENTSHHDYAPYIPEATKVSEAISELLHIPKALLYSLQFKRSNALEKAPVNKEKAQYPVLLYLTGLYGHRCISTFQIQELVSQGYIVVGIDCPMAVALATFPDGSTLQSLPRTLIDPMLNESLTEENPLLNYNGKTFEGGLIAYFAKDVLRVIDFLTALNTNDPNHLLYNKLNLDRLGAFGVSLGGIIVSEASWKAPRIKANLIMESQIPLKIAQTGLRVPTMVITRPAEAMRTERERSGGWTESDIQEHLSTMENLCKNTAESEFVQIPDIFHVDFTDAPLWVPFPHLLGFSGKTSIEETHHKLNELTLTFFEKHL